MTLIKSILENEIKDVLGHKPTTAEYKACLEYVMDATNTQKRPIMLVDIELAVRDWRSDYCVKCQSCGDYFLPEEMEYDRFCSEQCKAQYEEDECADMEHKIECQSRWNER